jgi:hypothetical protein
MKARQFLAGCGASLLIAGLAGCGGEGIIDDKGDGSGSAGGGGSEVIVVPRSVGGGVSESDGFAVVRDAAQLASLAGKREGAGHALQFLNDARGRFRRVLDIARRIEDAPLTRLNADTQTGDFTIAAAGGEDLCARISTAPFAVEAGTPPVGGAAVDADLQDSGGTADAVSLRVWINRSCSGLEEDYERFYASLLEARPQDVTLPAGDDSSEVAWRAGRGQAWIVPGALLGERGDYRAHAAWDHSDPLLRRTVLEEAGAIGDGVVIAGGRYLILREERGDEIVCKRVRAAVEFVEHPRLQRFDIRLGVCFGRTDEGQPAGRLGIGGSFVLADGREIVLDSGCFAADGDDGTECSGLLDAQLLDLEEPEIMSEPAEPTKTELPDESFDDLPAKADVDLDDDSDSADGESGGM